MCDELIKRLRETSVDFGELDHVSVMMIEAADAIEALWKLFQSSEKDNAKLTAWYVEKCNKHKWIPVTERLPDVGKDVLCFCRANICLVLSRDGNLWREGADRYYMSGFVTHWMPLPQPPESEDE